MKHLPFSLKYVFYSAVFEGFEGDWTVGKTFRPLCSVYRWQGTTDVRFFILVDFSISGRAPGWSHPILIFLKFENRTVSHPVVIILKFENRITSHSVLIFLKFENQMAGCPVLKFKKKWEPDKLEGGAHLVCKLWTGCHPIRFSKRFVNWTGWRPVHNLDFLFFFIFLWVVGMLCYRYG